MDGPLLDLLGEGEMFGFASLLVRGPLGFVARAAEDTLVYRIPARAIRPVLEQPAAARFIAHSMNKGVRLLAGQDPEPPRRRLGRPVGELVRAAALVCPPDTGVRDAARRMVEAGVDLRGGGPGGHTRHRHRPRHPRRGWWPPGAAGDSAVRRDDRAGVHGAADCSGAEALLEMLDHGIRHLPVLDAGRRLVGVLDDVDLLASERRAPFRLRALIARGADAAAVARPPPSFPTW